MATKAAQSAQFRCPWCESVTDPMSMPVFDHVYVLYLHITEMYFLTLLLAHSKSTHQNIKVVSSTRKKTLLRALPDKFIEGLKEHFAQ